jgi:subtilisin family serine protease
MAVTLHAEDPDALPAYAVAGEEVRRLAGAKPWPARVDRDWAFGDSTGAGATVCVVDSGIDAEHPLVRGVHTSVAVHVTDNEVLIEPDETGDVCGHGTACAGIIRSLAPECEIVSVRVLGEGFVGSGPTMLEGFLLAVG